MLKILFLQAIIVKLNVNTVKIKMSTVECQVSDGFVLSQYLHENMT